MPKIPGTKPANIIKILEKHGFILDRSKGSHRIYFNAETGKRAVVPFHNKDLPIGTLLEIIKQAGIDKEDLYR